LVGVAASGDEPAGRRGLDALLAEHAPRVRALRDALVAELGAGRVGDGTEYDDVWMLRFVLSNADDAEALSRARQTVEWRESKAEMLASARRGERLPRFARIETYVVSDYHGRTKEGAPLYVIRAGLTNTVAMMNANPEDVVVDFLLYRKEIGHLMCDEITRRTRTLTKLVTVNDLNHVSLLNGTDRRFTAILGKVSKMSEIYYPQLLDRAVLINVPYVFGAIWSLVKLALSSRTRAKVAVCGAADARTGDVAKCPFAKHLALDTVPSFIGGACRCKGGCVGGCPNEQTKPVGAIGSGGACDGMTLATVPARDKVEARVDVDEGDVVFFAIRSLEGGVNASAVLRERGGVRGGETVVETFKQKADMDAKEDAIVASKHGTLVFVFSNEHSWYNEKRIAYKFELREKERRAPA
jgi:hypothetical protein